MSRISVRMMLTEEDEMIIAFMSDYYCCCDAKFGNTSADMFYKFSSPCHNSMSFSITLIENVFAAIFVTNTNLRK